MKEISMLNQKHLKNNLPDLKPGDKVKVWQKIKEADKERLQSFEGVVIAIKHGRGVSATFTVRKISGGIGIERIFPLHSPNVGKIDILSRSKVRRARLYYLRERKGKRARMKMGLEKPEKAEVSAETAAAVQEKTEEDIKEQAK